MTGMAVGWIASTSLFGSVVRNADPVADARALYAPDRHGTAGARCSAFDPAPLRQNREHRSGLWHRDAEPCGLGKDFLAGTRAAQEGEMRRALQLGIARGAH